MVKRFLFIFFILFIFTLTHCKFCNLVESLKFSKKHLRQTHLKLEWNYRKNYIFRYLPPSPPSYTVGNERVHCHKSIKCFLREQHSPYKTFQKHFKLSIGWQLLYIHTHVLGLELSLRFPHCHCHCQCYCHCHCQCHCYQDILYSIQFTTD